MKKICKVILAAAAVVALAVPAMAADKLIIKGTDGTTTVTSISDAGVISLPSTLGKGASFSLAGALTNYSQLSIVADQTVPNAGGVLNIIPRGTGYSAKIKSQLAVYNTDYIADSTNYEQLVLRAAGPTYMINASTGGTGLLRPITFAFLNFPKVVYDTTGYVGINPSLSGANITVLPTHHLEVGNALTGAGSGTFAFYPVTVTTAQVAGGAAALPATPAGYATITINGVDRKIAYY